MSVYSNDAFLYYTYIKKIMYMYVYLIICILYSQEIKTKAK